MSNRPADLRRIHRAALLASVAFCAGLVTAPTIVLAAGGAGGAPTNDGATGQGVRGGAGGAADTRGTDASPASGPYAYYSSPGYGGAPGQSANNIVYYGQGGGGGGGGISAFNGATFLNSQSRTGGAGGMGGGAYYGGGGGGGGEGGHGAVVTGSGTNSNAATVTGGLGGTGGTAYGYQTNYFGAGSAGNGGDGGTGVVFKATGATFTNNAGGAITGGTGGQGGTIQNAANPGSVNGAGGAGGAGVTGARLTITNTLGASISGGRGGASGGSGGATGAGGVGITGADLTIVNAGTISGAMSGDNATRANAITFTGGVNSLTIASTSQITGKVAAYSASDTLLLGAGNGTFNLSQFGAAGSAAQYQGFGALQMGAGSWTLSGTSTIPIAYQVSGGTLNLGGATQTAKSLVITGGTLANGTLTSSGLFDVRDGTVSANLAGSGALTKSTTGTVVLSGTNTYTGATTINGGTLQVDGLLASSDVVVNSGGTLSGVGKIGDPLIASGGTLAPGNAANPYGTLTIVGPLTFAAGSFYNVNVSPTQNSRTNVVGTTTIQGGTVNVTAGTGTYATGTRYTILNATGGVTGAFAALATTTNLAFLTPTLAYDANNVFLNFAPTQEVTSPTGRQLPNYAIVASTQNQYNVAAGLTEAGRQNNGRGQALRALNQLTAPQARAAFDSLSGEGVTGAQNVAFRSSQLFTSAMFDQTTFYGSGGAANSITLTAPQFGLLGSQPVRELADLPARSFQPVVPAPATRTWRAWATGFGGIENISGNRTLGSAAQRNDVYGGALGVDYQLTPNYLIGVAVGGSNGDFRVNARGTSGSTTGGHVAIYDLYELGNWYGASSSSFSYFGNQTTRFVNGFGGLGTEQNRGNFNSNEFRSRVEIGRHFSSLPLPGGLPTIVGFGTVTPFVALEIASLRSNGFTETPLKGGPGLMRLNVSGQTAASAPGFVGLRFQSVASLGNGMVLRPTLQLAYVHEFAPYRDQIGTIASLPGSTFLVDGARPARDAAQVKVGGELAIGPRSAIFANFDSELSRVNQLYAGKGGFRYMW